MQDHLRRWFNGYSWDGTTTVYNPFSLLNVFHSGTFSNYWAASGNPSLLINYLRRKNLSPIQIQHLRVEQQALKSHQIDNLDPIMLLFESGYLTIKEKHTTGMETSYRLDYPNKEVAESFLKNLFASYAEQPEHRLSAIVKQLTKSLREDALENFFEQLNHIFAMIPYNIFINQKEAYYHSVVYLVLKLIGIDIRAEVQTNRGRIDAVLYLEDRIYVMEFKMEELETALTQMKARDYKKALEAEGKRVVGVAVSFCEEARHVGGWRVVA